MLQNDENDRPDFKELDKIIVTKFADVLSRNNSQMEDSSSTM